MRMSCKEKWGLGIAAGVMTMAIIIPMCCLSTKCPEKRFVDGGKEMLGAIPDIAKGCALKVVRKII